MRSVPSKSVVIVHKFSALKFLTCSNKILREEISGIEEGQITDVPQDLNLLDGALVIILTPFLLE